MAWIQVMTTTPTPGHGSLHHDHEHVNFYSRVPAGDPRFAMPNIETHSSCMVAIDVAGAGTLSRPSSWTALRGALEVLKHTCVDFQGYGHMPHSQGGLMKENGFVFLIANPARFRGLQECLEGHHKDLEQCAHETLLPAGEPDEAVSPHGSLGSGNNRMSLSYSDLSRSDSGHSGSLNPSSPEPSSPRPGTPPRVGSPALLYVASPLSRNPSSSLGSANPSPPNVQHSAPDTPQSGPGSGKGNLGISSVGSVHSGSKSNLGRRKVPIKIRGRRRANRWR